MKFLSSFGALKPKTEKEAGGGGGVVGESLSVPERSRAPSCITFFTVKPQPQLGHWPEVLINTAGKFGSSRWQPRDL